MTKFIQIVLVVALAALCSAGPARLRNIKQSRFSARQELAEDIPAQTPYPPAGIIPEVRFDLPADESVLQPENTYLPPDNVGGIPAQTYGPPEVVNDDVAVVEETEVQTEVEAEVEPAVEAEEEAVVETDIEQPKEVEVLEQSQVQELLKDNEIENPQSERLVRRRSSKLRSAKLQVRPSVVVRSQRLVAQPIRLRSQRVVAQPVYFTNGRLINYNTQFLRV